MLARAARHWCMEAEVASLGPAAYVPGQRSAETPGANAATGHAPERACRTKIPGVGYSTVTPRTGCMGLGTSILFPHQRGSGARFKRRTKASLKAMSTQIIKISPGEAYATDGKGHFTAECLPRTGIGLGADTIRNAYLARAKLLMKG